MQLMARIMQLADEPLSEIFPNTEDKKHAIALAIVCSDKGAANRVPSLGHSRGRCGAETAREPSAARAAIVGSRSARDVRKSVLSALAPRP